MNKEKYVLVIGSKPNSRLPKLDVLKIYTANGAAERANIYSNEFGSKELIAVVGTMEFFKNQAVRERILNSNPNFSIMRPLSSRFFQFLLDIELLTPFCKCS